MVRNAGVSAEQVCPERESAPAATALPFVLYLENNTANLFLMEVVLRQNGALEMVAARSPEQALAVLDTGSPLAVIADLHLPGMGGMTGLRRLRSHPAMTGSALIAISTDDDPTLERAARQAGCDAFMTEPLDLERLAALFHSLVTAAQRARGAVA